MAINDKPYGALITTGLGYSYSTYITANIFSLELGLEVVVPPVEEEKPRGGTIWGGGTVYVPFPEHLRKKRKLLIFTVNGPDNFHWKKEYLVDINKVDYVVKIFNFTTRILTVAESTYKVTVKGIQNLSESVKTTVGNIKTVASSVAESTIKVGNLVTKAVKPIVTFIRKDK